MTARELQAQKTYENIILTAEQLTENNSFENISVDLICAKAGISKGGFYHHFPSKDQLISLLIGRQMGNLIEERIEPFFNKKNAFALLQIYIDTMVSYMGKQSAKCTGKMRGRTFRTPGNDQCSICTKFFPYHS